ncbi:MAG TPA: copper chaperone PCu(A)C [Thermohalobaculum sp.]|nr:copper chaperone PCu(A)C [Thermohalobaculum sp.]
MQRIIASALAAVLTAAVLTVAVIGGSGLGAQDAVLGDLMLSHPTARPNLPNRPAVAYVTIMNHGAVPDRLVGVTSPEFESAELHSASMSDGVMTMHPVDAIEIPPGGTVELTTGGYHIMLFGARRMFKPGESFPMVLTFEGAGEATVQAMVEKLDPSAMGHGQTDHGHTKHMQPSN